MHLGACIWCYAGHVLCSSVRTHDVALDPSYVLPCAHMMLCYTHLMYFGACMWCYAGHVPCTWVHTHDVTLNTIYVLRCAHTILRLTRLAAAVDAQDVTSDKSCILWCPHITLRWTWQVLSCPVRHYFFQVPTGMQDEPWTLQMGIEIDTPLLRRLWYQAILRGFAVTFFCYSSVPCGHNCACMTNIFFLAMTYNYFRSGKLLEEMPERSCNLPSER